MRMMNFAPARRPRRPRIRILRFPPGTVAAVIAMAAGGLAGCQPQQTDIVSEVHAPDGTVTRYVNRSSGYGYNPNMTGTTSGTAFVDANGNIASPGYYGIVACNGGGWGYGYGPYRPWPCMGWPGFASAWAGSCYASPGSASIPQNTNVYGYNPGVAWNGSVTPANPALPMSH
jgi:hypothetical protein